MTGTIGRVSWLGLLGMLLVACEGADEPETTKDAGPPRDEKEAAPPPDSGSPKDEPDAAVDSGVAPTTNDDAGSSAGEGDAEIDVIVDAPTDAGVAKVTVRGRLTDPTGKELGGVTIQVGPTKQVVTDSRGLFEVAVAESGPLQVAVVDPEYSASQATVTVGGDEIAQVALTALPMQTIEVVLDGQAAATVALGTAVLQLPLVGVVNSEGEAVTGAVQVHFAELANSEALLAAPGGMMATDDNDELVELESFGMIDVELYQDGEPLALAEPAQLTLTAVGLAAGETVPVWSFDEEAGTWTNEGEAEVDSNNQVTVTVPALSWWNLDRPLAEKSCITGRLVGDNGEGVSNVHVNVTGVDYLTNLSATSGTDGTFCATVKRGSTNRITAFGVGSGNYFTFTSNDIVATDTATSCDLGGCTNLGELSGEPLFAVCEGNVTDDENHVLVLSSGLTTLDDAVKATLERFGNEVTVGPAFTAFDGTVSLSDYDVVYLQANNNWAAGDMPLDGQRQLINWVNCGGGLLTVEWTVWKIGTGQFALLDSVYPTVPTTAYGSSATAAYIQVTPDETMNHALPESFTFTADSFAGTEIDLNPRPGSTEFYDSETRIAGVVGWDFNLGRVVSISTVGGEQELADPNYSQLIANAVDWLQRDPANDPE